MKKVGDELQKRLMEKVPVGSEVSTNLFRSDVLHTVLKRKTVNWRRTSHAWKPVLSVLRGETGVTAMGMKQIKTSLQLVVKC